MVLQEALEGLFGLLVLDPGLLLLLLLSLHLVGVEGLLLLAQLGQRTLTARHTAHGQVKGVPSHTVCREALHPLWITSFTR